MFGTLVSDVQRKEALVFVENTDQASALSRSRREKIHISCVACRARKVRCSGQPSGCDRCAAVFAECRYPAGEGRGRKSSTNSSSAAPPQQRSPRGIHVAASTTADSSRNPSSCPSPRAANDGISEDVQQWLNIDTDIPDALSMALLEPSSLDIGMDDATWDNFAQEANRLIESSAGTSVEDTLSSNFSSISPLLQQKSLSDATNHDPNERWRSAPDLSRWFVDHHQLPLTPAPSSTHDQRRQSSYAPTPALSSSSSSTTTTQHHQQQRRQSYAPPSSSSLPSKPQPQPHLQPQCHCLHLAASLLQDLSEKGAGATLSCPASAPASAPTTTSTTTSSLPTSSLPSTSPSLPSLSTTTAPSHSISSPTGPPPIPIDVLLAFSRRALDRAAAILDCERCAAAASETNMLLAMAAGYMADVFEAMVRAWDALGTRRERRGRDRGEQRGEQRWGWGVGLDPGSSSSRRGEVGVAPAGAGGDQLEDGEMDGGGEEGEGAGAALWGGGGAAGTGGAAEHHMWFSSYCVENGGERVAVVQGLVSVQLGEYLRLLKRLKARAGGRLGHLVLLREADQKIKAVRAMMGVGGQSSLDRPVSRGAQD
ncbi:c6 zinc finger domain protein [Diplodia corticola]|uniref:C6 zinc finger domain protein n=1 Tax=Diplodia corticola TaxID=236234 RepID=A0A1J9RWC3_9PEZI|nr:c6 zinc finger domain protein [Diplodia corticola]OJD32140.1 c6 zinc finger domain protein [Diplodia corticola]